MSKPYVAVYGCSEIVLPNSFDPFAACPGCGSELVECRRLNENQRDFL